MGRITFQELATSLKDFIQNIRGDFDTHDGNNTIHFGKSEVDKTDVGLSNVTNDEQATKTEFNAHTA